MRHHAHIGVGVHVGRGTLQNEACDVRDGRGRAGTRTVGDTEIPRTQKCLIVQKSCICQRHLRRANTQKSHAAHAACAFAVVLGWIELKGGGGTPQTRMQSFDVGPFLHRLHGIGAAFEFRGNRFPIVAKRADGAEAGDDNALFIAHAKPPLTPMT